jgi:hypothetical protein
MSTRAAARRRSNSALASSDALAVSSGVARPSGPGTALYPTLRFGSKLNSTSSPPSALPFFWVASSAGFSGSSTS